jgi:glycosyltransferase involved in cell wall biosynthesis
MRVVWVAHDHGLNAGAELCLWEDVKGLVAAHHDVRVVAPAFGKLTERLQECGIPVSVIHYSWWMHSSFRLPVKRMWRNLQAAAKIAELLGEIQPDVVITNTLTIPVGALAARRAHVPHLWYIHEFGREDHGLKFDLGSSVSLAIIRRLSKKVIVNSTAVREKFRCRIPEHQLRVLHYAVDVPSCPGRGPQSDEPFRLILVGRICPGKRQEDAIRAVASLNRKGIRPHLGLLGNENVGYGAFLRNLARELGVADQIEFIPFTDDPFTHIADAHVALVCSKSEAFGRVTIEAMKQGKPVVGANIGGTSELINDGVTGLLYQPMDAEDLGRKIEALYRNRPLLRTMGNNALGWSIRTFNLEAHMSALVAILKEAAAG